MTRWIVARENLKNAVETNYSVQKDNEQIGIGIPCEFDGQASFFWGSSRMTGEESGVFSDFNPNVQVFTTYPDIVLPED